MNGKLAKKYRRAYKRDLKQLLSTLAMAPFRLRLKVAWEIVKG